MMSTRKELLFLVHRIPYPPNKGDKIRSYNLLTHLAKKYTVHLGTFIDDPADSHYENDVKRLCGEVCIQTLRPGFRKLASLQGLLRGESLTVPYYRNSQMSHWVKSILRKKKIDGIVVFSSPMTQYVTGKEYFSYKRVADFVDIDSDKWAQYAKSKPWPASWIYRRESEFLLKFEKEVATEFDATVFVSETEAKMFSCLLAESSQRIHAIQNGVDSEYFSPDRVYPNPYDPNQKIIVFTGAMDYWANIEAVTWFVNNVMADVTEVMPNTVFYIVGSRPSREVISLAKNENVYVTGSVHDIRPYIAHADLSVAPMNIARGVQNKVLEAMAMGIPVLATPEAAEGIVAKKGEDFAVEKGARNFRMRVIEMLKQPPIDMARSGRRCILRNYNWDENLSQFDRLISIGDMP